MEGFSKDDGDGLYDDLIQLVDNKMDIENFLKIYPVANYLFYEEEELVDNFKDFEDPDLGLRSLLCSELFSSKEAFIDYDFKYNEKLGEVTIEIDSEKKTYVIRKKKKNVFT